MIYQNTTVLLLLSGALYAQTLPNTPINVGAYAFTDTSARLSFLDQSDNEDGFKIYHNGVEIANIPPKEGSETYQYKTLIDLEPCSLYTVDLVAYNESGESSPVVKSFRTVGCELPNEAPVVSAGENQSLTLGESINLVGTAYDKDGSVVSYEWTSEGVLLSTEASFTYTPQKSGIELLTLSVKDDDGAVGTDEVKLFIESVEDQEEETNSSVVVNITDFGAIPDDGVDDTQAITEALKVSGHITMPRGVYNVERLFRDGTTVIDGNGSTFKARRTEFGTSSNILTLSNNALDEEIKISNLVFDGDCPTQYPREGDEVASLVHIYDAAHVTFQNIFIKDYSSQYYSQDLLSGDESHHLRMNEDHTFDMFHDLIIAFSSDINIINFEQANIKIEGPLIYESDNILIDNFKSTTSNSIWTALHVVASDNITLRHAVVSDGYVNSRGSSINFFANHYFEVEDVNTTNKDGFDISNEVDGVEEGRVTRDTSFGTFKHCNFKGYHPFQAYPTKSIHEELSFEDTSFIPALVQDGGYNVRFEIAGDLSFKDCTFGSSSIGTEYQMIMGNVKHLSIENSRFINTSREDHLPIGIYLNGADFGDISIIGNNFTGTDYTPIVLRRNNGGKYGDGFEIDSLTLESNLADTDPLFVNTTGFTIPTE